MNLNQYETLTGTTVAAGDVARVTAVLARVQSMLETILGFTLDPTKVNTNLYNELGKTSTECSCPDVDSEDLQPADAVVTAYRLFNFNDLDQYLWIEPFSSINKVKLVYIKQGSGTTGVTLKTFEDDELRVHGGQDGIKKYLERCLNCFCLCTCTECVQLAVDAVWLWADADDIPKDLLYVWTDMVTWYSNPKTNIKSETIDTHSYTKFDDTPPEMEPFNLAILKKYAGPNGSLTVMPTEGARGRR